MSVETYWLVVPLAGLALTVPAWAWLLWSLHRRRRSPRWPARCRP